MREPPSPSAPFLLLVAATLLPLCLAARPPDESISGTRPRTIFAPYYAMWHCDSSFLSSKNSNELTRTRFVVNPTARALDGRGTAIAPIALEAHEHKGTYRGEWAATLGDGFAIGDSEFQSQQLPSAAHQLRVSNLQDRRSGFPLVCMSCPPAELNCLTSEERRDHPDHKKGKQEPTATPPPAKEIQKAGSRWRTYDLNGNPQYTFRIQDPYHQNILKADFPVTGNWFLELTAFNNLVYKSRRNLDFSKVFAPEIAAGNFKFVRHNNFFNENLIFGAEIRRFDDTFVPSDFRFRVNGVIDYKRDINAFNDGTHGRPHLFDAFADFRLHDFGGQGQAADGHYNFDLVFLRGGLQTFRSDFHGLVLNDVGLGGRVFGEAKRNRLRYDFAWLKLFQRDAVSGFIDLSKPSRHQVVIARFTWDDLLLGWNSEWSFHYNRDRRKVPSSTVGANLDTFYGGATLNGHLGRFTFNPAAYFVLGHADRLVAGVPVKHDVAAWMGVLDWQFKLDYWNFRAGYFYASGDGDPTDSRDTGFDAINDGVTLFGGPLSYWVGENIKFGKGDFVRANSLLPSFRGVNDPANHINPGIYAFNAGVDVVLSPRFEASANFNYLRFAKTGVYPNSVVNKNIVVNHHSAGVEENFFLRIKPFLRETNQNVVFDLGVSALQPQQGLQSAFQSKGTVFSTFLALRLVY